MVRCMAKDSKPHKNRPLGESQEQDTCDSMHERTVHVYNKRLVRKLDKGERASRDWSVTNLPLHLGLIPDAQQRPAQPTLLGSPRISLHYRESAIALLDEDKVSRALCGVLSEKVKPRKVILRKYEAESHVSLAKHPLSRQI